MLAAEKHKGTFMAPIGIGLSLFVAEITGKHLIPPSANLIKHLPHATPL
jgi:aquaporin related protein